ncbi:MAG: [FeFe] hydrogenase H-cluster radical SAM maturase HydE [Bacteroidales bacterium]|nr:[FeFe] hydrogenase H-cluster radical SAM maturase HydE [Bacteroidales bacterium]
MINIIDDILLKDNFTHEELMILLASDVEGRNKIFKKAAQIKEDYVGNIVYFRGLIEYSNSCVKNCYYCGIRAGNKFSTRYNLTDEEVFDAVRYAYENNFASIVIQSGERVNVGFTEKISALLKEIKQISKGTMGVTLSLGEQDLETYQKWFKAGAHRYLLRIETSNRELYKKIHPDDAMHDYNVRLEALKNLKKAGFQVGTGVMVGLPFQTISDLADDLIFFKELDIDMAGLGPYIEHHQTPLYIEKDRLISKTERFNLSLKMIALLRIMMKDINIAATTAMQAIDPMGREKAIKVGANVIMPNLTPIKYRENYQLYEDKPCMDEEADECKNCLEARIKIAGHTIGYGEWGDSLHFKKRKGLI